MDNERTIWLRVPPNTLYKITVEEAEEIIEHLRDQIDNPDWEDEDDEVD